MTNNTTRPASQANYTPAGYYSGPGSNLGKSVQKPFKKIYSNSLYDALFCDDVRIYRAEESIAFYPWDLLLDSSCPTDKLYSILADEQAAARSRILASGMLAKAGNPVGPNTFLGAILEINQRNGLDVLAVYADGSARYINHLEQVVVWERNTEEYKNLHQHLCQNAKGVLDTNTFEFLPRQPFPVIGRARLSVLGSHGLSATEYEVRNLRREFQKSNLVSDCLRIMVYLSSQKNKLGKGNSNTVFT